MKYHSCAVLIVVMTTPTLPSEAPSAPKFKCKVNTSVGQPGAALAQAPHAHEFPSPTRRGEMVCTGPAHIFQCQFLPVWTICPFSCFSSSLTKKTKYQLQRTRSENATGRRDRLQNILPALLPELLFRMVPSAPWNTLRQDCAHLVIISWRREWILSTK